MSLDFEVLATTQSVHHNIISEIRKIYLQFLALNNKFSKKKNRMVC